MWLKHVYNVCASGHELVAEGGLSRKLVKKALTFIDGETVSHLIEPFLVPLTRNTQYDQTYVSVETVSGFRSHAGQTLPPMIQTCEAFSFWRACHGVRMVGSRYSSILSSRRD